MNNDSSEHNKPPLYWLTLAIIFAAFFALVLT